MIMKLSMLIGLILFLFCFLQAQQPAPSGRRIIQDERLRNLTRPQILPQNLLRLQTTIVPPLEGREFRRGQIVSELQELRLNLGEVVEKADNSMAGLIIRQDPGPGVQVLAGTSVNLIIAVEVPVEVIQTITVPDVTGFPVEQARQIIAASRLRPGDETRLPSDQQEGLVINQFPEEGMFVDPGTPVYFYVSEGQQIQEVFVPNLVGMSLEGAADVLKTGNLRLGSLGEEFSEGQEGIIRSQFPSPGTLVIPATVVDLVYSVSRRIPDVRGRPLDEAVEFLRSVDLYVAVIVDRKSAGPPGIVIDQSPSPGSVFRPGSEMKLIQSVPAASVPLWIYWSAGVIVVAAGGIIIIRKMRQSRKKRVQIQSEGYELRLVPDSGKQELQVPVGTEAPEGITFRLIQDKGIQSIEY